MKSLHLTIALLVFLQACKTTNTENTLTSYDVSLQNTLDTERTDETIVIKKSDLETLTTTIPTDKFPIFQVNGNAIPTQTDDLDGDGVWDEVVVLYSFQPQETVVCQVSFVGKEELPSFPKRTDAALFLSPNRDKTGYQRVKEEIMPAETSADPKKTVLSYQMEGPGWENDKVAFRSYFDYRNGKDIFGKIIPDLCLDSIGTSGDYHQMQYWGMDVLKVGNSLGAGALAVLEDNKLFRLGKADEIRYQLVSTGAIRSVIRLHYKGWQYAGNQIDVTHQISIYAGKYAYRSDVTLSGFEGNKELVTGIVTMKLKDTPVFEENDAFAILATHDKQSEQTPEPDYLGMGLLVPKKSFLGKNNAPVKEKWEGDEVVNTYYARLKAEANTPTTFYFYAGWEKTNPNFVSKDAFISLLKADAEKLATPITVSKPQ